METKSPFLSIILPTYNEAENIVPLIRKINRELKSIGHEIIVVDDNSPDGTAKCVLQEYSRQINIKVFTRKKNPGLANSILFGIKNAVGRYICVMDTDFNHDPEVIPAMLNMIKDSDLVVGSRYITGGGMENRLRHFLSLVYNMFIKAVLHLPTHDNLSGFFIANRNKLIKLDTVKIFSGYGDYFIVLLYLAHKAHFRITEIPVFYKNRIYGFSKSRFLPMFIGYSKTVLKLLFSNENV